MARERYLVGVSKEELEYTPPPPPPSTPKGKLENFWYHYKWATIGVLFAAVVLTMLIVQVVTKERPDYQVCLAAPQEMSSVAVQRLEDELEKLAVDRNGDGEVLVRIQAMNISDQAGSYGYANKQALMAHIAARDVQLFIFDPTYYNNSLVAAMTDGTTFFTKLSSAANGMSEDGTYWNWKNCPLLSETEFALAGAVPEELYFGVRQIWSGASEKEQAEHRDTVALLEAFIASQSVE